MRMAHYYQCRNYHYYHYTSIAEQRYSLHSNVFRGPCHGNVRSFGDRPASSFFFLPRPLGLYPLPSSTPTHSAELEETSESIGCARCSRVYTHVD